MKRNPTERNLKIARLADAIGKVGCDVSAASRKAGIISGTAEYWYKTRLLGNGFKIHAAIAYEKVGLRCLVMIVQIGEKFSKRADRIFRAMGEKTFVESYSRTIPFGYYFVIASVPEEHIGAFIEFARGMKKVGFFTSLRIFKADWRRDVPMRTEFFDFEHCVWDFDWARARIRYDEAKQTSEAVKVDVDFKDLKILKQLQLDADTTLADISKRVGVKDRSLRQHHRDHVLGHGLIRCYTLDWYGAATKRMRQEVRAGRRNYLGFHVLVNGLDKNQKMEVRAYFNQLPFVWREAGGERFYYAEGAFPTDAISEGYEAMGKIAERLGFKLEFFVRDPKGASTFGIATQLFEPKTRKWRFDSQTVLVDVKALLR